MERGEVGTATYVISKATNDDAGWYQCTAQNDHGKAYKRIELIGKQNQLFETLSAEQVFRKKFSASKI